MYIKFTEMCVRSLYLMVAYAVVDQSYAYMYDV